MAEFKDIETLIASVKQVGPSISLYDRSKEELLKIAGELVFLLDAERLRHFAATSIYSESFSKTEWAVVDHNTNFALVWIAKRVTRYMGSHLEATEEELVLTVHRDIAQRLVDLLNSQKPFDRSCESAA